MKTDRKPPLAAVRSPIRLRNRRVLQPSNIITPLSNSSVAMTKPQMKESGIKPVNQAISSELNALSKMVQEELGAMNAKTNYYNSSITTPSVRSDFERGQFYDEYTARRNEKLRRKQSERQMDEPKTAYSLGVKVESSVMKKDVKKKSVTNYASVDRSQHSRYALRSTVKKPPMLPVPIYVEEQMTARRTVASRSRRK